MAKTRKAVVNYSHFGQYGGSFQDLFDSTMRLTRVAWQMQQQRHGGPNLERAFQSYMQRSGFWFSMLMSLSGVFEVLPMAEFVRLWEEWRNVFSPSLRPGQELSADRRGVLLRAALEEAITAARTQEPLWSVRRQLNEICYGPFSDLEMGYLMDRHPRILEVGAGSGYFAWLFSSVGGDIIALDNNRYEITSGTTSWTHTLLEQGRLIVGGPERIAEFAADRTLLISWPEPGSAFPAVALEAYAVAGGKYLALKIGGFVGTYMTAQQYYVPPENAGQNILRFFRRLAAGWEEVQEYERPRFIPQAYNNNLWLFRRRD